MPSKIIHRFYCLLSQFPLYNVGRKNKFFVLKSPRMLILESNKLLCDLQDAYKNTGLLLVVMLPRNANNNMVSKPEEKNPHKQSRDREKDRASHS